MNIEKKINNIFYNISIIFINTMENLHIKIIIYFVYILF
jgi:hypothetical protein